MIHRFSVEIGGKEEAVSVEIVEPGRYRVTRGQNSQLLSAQKTLSSHKAATWLLLPEGGGRATLVDVDGTTPELTVTVGGVSVVAKVADTRSKLRTATARRQEQGPLSIRSPMHGKIIRVLCAAGSAVTAGQGLLVVEAMKMENELRAPRAGTLKAVSVTEGQAVEAGQTLATLE